MTNDPITIGFTLIGDGSWRGGLNYQKTLLELIAGQLSSELKGIVFVSHAQEALAQEHFGHLSQQVPIVVDKRASGAGVGTRAIVAVLTGRDRAFQELLIENKVDVAFENARFFGRSFAVPVLSWIPDFQHRYLPQLFALKARIKRDIGFSAQCYGRRRILLSSYTAQRDCELFYPRSKGRTHVARFCNELDIESILTRAGVVRTEYDLPETFFYVPNHFWSHKNHEVVLESLLLLKQGKRLESVPLIVMSGPTSDSRKTGLFDRFMRRVQENGLSPWLRHVGLIPYSDVLALNAASCAVLNPSKFEGWSSSVEEAKSLGSRLIVSDIPVHREQAPNAIFFTPDDASSLATIIELNTCTINKGDTSATDLNLLNKTRQIEFSSSFLKTIKAAHNL